jgi:molybdenum cofactor synthesis domain-containing protein
MSSTLDGRGAPLTAAVLTVSDSVAAGSRHDLSGPAVAAILTQNKFQVVLTEVVPDKRAEIERALVRLVQEVRLVITTGGTGIAVRDVTPEATRNVCERLLEGVAERMRAEGVKKTPLAALSRGLCGVREQSLLLNLPGSPTGAAESLAAVIGILPHALDLLAGKTDHK